MKNIFLSICMAAVLASCSAVPNTQNKVGSTQASISNSSWVLAESVKGKTPTLVINNDKISGDASCNRYFGSLNLDATAGNFTAGQIGSTRMMCDQMDTETNYLKTLQQANKYVVDGNTLSLYKDQILLLKFNRQ